LRSVGARQTVSLPLLAGLCGLAATPVAALDIHHAPAVCVVAERYPEIAARFVPATGVAHALVRFRAAGSPEWYGVAMEPRGALRVGTLPRPLASLEAVEYYIEAVGTDTRALRTPVYRARVVAGARECPTAGVGIAAAESVLLAAPGAPPFPVGFLSAGDEALAPIRSADAPPQEETSAEPKVIETRPARPSKGGFPTTLLVGGIAAGGAVGALVARTSSGDDGAASDTGDATVPREGVEGGWLAEVTGTRVARETDCRSTATLALELGIPSAGLLDGSATTTELILEPPGCGEAVPIGQTKALAGKSEGEQIYLEVDASPGQPPFAYIGTLQGDRMRGTVSQPAVGELGAFSGEWTASRR